jgi:hypothetical protein
MIRNKNETSMAFKSNKMTQKDGYDIARLLSPSIENLNDDFLCGIC